MHHDLIATDHEQALALLESRFAARAIATPSGARVIVREAGLTIAQAPVIVFLHGISSGAASWLHVALALGEQARVVAWDAPGYGDSTALASAEPTAADYAERLQQVLSVMAIDQCVLVGHSLGALMAAAVAAGPEAAKVRRLVLISPARGYGAAAQAETRRTVLDARLRALRDGGIEALAPATPKRLLCDTASDSAHAWVRWNVSRLNPAGYTQAVHMLCNDDIHRFAPLPMPVDVLCGDADIVTPPAACAAVARHFGTELDAIPGAGHASPVEQPITVARHIARAAALSLGGPST